MNKQFFLYIGFILDFFASGSVIVFRSSPTRVVQGLTGSAVLRCGLNDTAASASVVGRRDTERTADNVKRVSSIIITQGGQDIASVSQGSAGLLVAASNVEVKGDVDQSSGERGYLEMTLHYPMESQAGEYQCEITAVSSSGHGVIYKTKLEMSLNQPTVVDLVNEIKNSKIREAQQASVIQTLQQTVTSQQQTISSLQTEIADLQVSGWSAPSSGLQVRLLGSVVGNDGTWGRGSGAVQVRYNGKTGMLCDDLFDSNNNGAQVVCRMLGYSGGSYMDGNLFVGVNTTDTRPADLYLLDDVTCGGTEADLAACRHRGWGVQGVCRYDEIAGVHCSV